MYNLTIMKVLVKTTRGLVHLQLLRPSVIRGPWSSLLHGYHKKFNSKLLIDFIVKQMYTISDMILVKSHIL